LIRSDWAVNSEIVTQLNISKTCTTTMYTAMIVKMMRCIPIQKNKILRSNHNSYSFTTSERPIRPKHFNDTNCQRIVFLFRLLLLCCKRCYCQKYQHRHNCWFDFHLTLQFADQPQSDYLLARCALRATSPSLREPTLA